MNSYNLAGNNWWPPGEQAAHEYFEYAAEYNRAVCLHQYDSVIASAAEVHIGNDSGSRIAGALRKFIDDRTPASMIRLGDADGNVLFSAMGIYSRLAEYNLQKISSIYFGNKNVMPANIRFFIDSVLEGIEFADLIGGPERGTIDKSFETPIADLDVRGMCGMRGVYNYLASSNFDLASLSQSIWSSTWFSRALLPHYFSLLHRQPYVGFITCYPELAAAFRERAEIRDTETILVPMQASVARVNHDIRHYPDAYPGILESIRPPRQGAIFIVAAGILSKPYCTAVKRRGGIAIDVGSVADVWMGTVSRPNMPKNMVEKWRLI